MPKMPNYRAEVRPDQSWDQDGTANVTPMPPYQDPNPFSLPLEHREGGPVVVERSTYPEGLVIIPNIATAGMETAVLPMEVSSGSTIEITNGEHQDWPEGVVARFID